MSVLKAQIIGHLGNDGLVNQVNGKSVINFTVAHSEKFKNAAGVQQERTTWVSVSYWTDRTAIAPYLKKGTLVNVEGRPDASTYQDKTGQTVAQLRITATQVNLLSAAKNNSSGNNNVSREDVITPENITEPIDGLPF